MDGDYGIFGWAQANTLDLDLLEDACVSQLCHRTCEELDAAAVVLVIIRGFNDLLFQFQVHGLLIPFILLDRRHFKQLGWVDFPLNREAASQKHCGQEITA